MFALFMLLCLLPVVLKTGEVSSLRKTLNDFTLATEKPSNFVLSLLRESAMSFFFPLASLVSCC
jgi:hypothetical protein